MCELFTVKNFESNERKLNDSASVVESIPLTINSGNESRARFVGVLLWTISFPF